MKTWKIIAEETHKGHNAKVTHREVVEAAKEAMIESLGSRREMTESELYFATDINFNSHYAPLVRAREELIRENKISKRHEMVNGFKSTNFYSLT